MDAPSDQRAPVASQATARYGHGRGETSIADLLERVAGEHPDRPAVIADDDTTTTWGALDARARAFGADLRRRVPEGPHRSIGRRPRGRTSSGGVGLRGRGRLGHLHRTAGRGHRSR